MDAIDIDPLPYQQNSLEPYISAASVGAHRILQMRYVQRVNDLAPSTYIRAVRSGGLAGIINLANERNDREMFDNAAQAFNHAFWWNSLRPCGSYSEPSGILRTMIDRRYATLDTCITAAVVKSRSLFGSGWLWLVIRDGSRLEWRVTPNATIPGRGRGTMDVPIMTIDLWEHAYCWDYPPEHAWGTPSRETYVRSVLENLANWDFASQQASVVRD